MHYIRTIQRRAYSVSFALNLLSSSEVLAPSVGHTTGRFDMIMFRPLFVVCAFLVCLTPTPFTALRGERKEVMRHLGDRVLLPCTLTFDNKTETRYWSFDPWRNDSFESFYTEWPQDNDSHWKPGNRSETMQIHTNFTLLILNARSTDIGYYRCGKSLKNGLQTVGRILNLRVIADQPVPTSVETATETATTTETATSTVPKPPKTIIVICVSLLLLLLLFIVIVVIIMRKRRSDGSSIRMSDGEQAGTLEMRNHEEEERAPTLAQVGQERDVNHNNEEVMWSLHALFADLKIFRDSLTDVIDRCRDEERNIGTKKRMCRILESYFPLGRQDISHERSDIVIPHKLPVEDDNTAQAFSNYATALMALVKIDDQRKAMQLENDLLINETPTQTPSSDISSPEFPPIFVSSENEIPQSDHSPGVKYSLYCTTDFHFKQLVHTELRVLDESEQRHGGTQMRKIIRSNFKKNNQPGTPLPSTKDNQDMGDSPSEVIAQGISRTLIGLCHSFEKMVQVQLQILTDVIYAIRPAPNPEHAFLKGVQESTTTQVTACDEPDEEDELDTSMQYSLLDQTDSTVVTCLETTSWSTPIQGHD